GFLYHGERIEGDRLLIEIPGRGIRGWVPLIAVVPVSEADAYFSQEILRHPDSSFAHLMRALSRFDLEDFRSALDDLNEALRLDSKNVPALITRAYVRRIMQRPEHAVADANQAVVLDPRNCYVLEQRAM